MLNNLRQVLLKIGILGRSMTGIINRYWICIKNGKIIILIVTIIIVITIIVKIMMMVMDMDMDMRIIKIILDWNLNKMVKFVTMIEFLLVWEIYNLGKI